MRLKRYLFCFVCIVLGFLSIGFSMCKKHGCEQVHFLRILSKHIHGVEIKLLDKNLVEDFFDVYIESFPEYKNGYIRCVGVIEKLNCKVDLYIKKESGSNPVREVQRGDLIKLSGLVKVPEHPRNKGEFDFREYQITRGVSGSLYTSIEKCELVKRSNNIIYRFKNYLISSINENFPSEYSGVISSMLLGFKGDLDEAFKERLSNAGVSHVIAISGLHFSCIIAFVLSFVGKNQRRRRRKNIFILTCVFLYVVLVGYSSSVIRAAVMIGGKLVAVLFKREQDTVTLLSVSALIEIIINPLVFLTLSFQLSYLSFLGVIYIAPKVTKLINRLLTNQLNEYVVQSIAVSFGASLAILPVLINAFGKVAFVSVIINILVVPISEMILILGLIWSMVSLVFPDVAKILVIVISSLIKSLDFVAGFWQDEKGKIFIAQIGFAQIVLYYTLVIVCLFCPVKKYRKIFVGCMSLLLIISFIMPAVSLEPAVKMTVFDVGQGDCSLLQFDNGTTVLIDSGEGKTNMAELLQKNGIRKIDIVVATHMHDDHIGGFENFGNIKIENFIVPAEADCNVFDKSFFSKILRKQEAVAGQVYKLGEVSLTILSPSDTKTSENNRSVVLYVEYKDTEILLCGDAEVEAEKNIIEMYGEAIDCDIIKVGHHGSDTSSSEMFVRKANPEYAVISVGRNNNYGHPAKSVIDRYESNGSTVLRTDLLGSISMSLFGDNVKIRFHKEYFCR